MSIIIPCHRVIGSGGTLTGYGGGLWRKQRLLDLGAEVAIATPRPARSVRRCSTLFSMAQAGVAHRVDHVLDSFLRQITAVRGDVVELYLYGSRARGDHHPDSDYDVFVVLHERTRDTIDRLYDAVVDVVCESGSLVSLKIVSREQFSEIGGRRAIRL